MKELVICVLLICLAGWSCKSEKIHVRFADLLTPGQITDGVTWVWRSAATGRKTLRLVGSHRVTAFLCLESPNDRAGIQIEEFVISNDGLYDKFQIHLGRNRFDVMSPAVFGKFGHGWNSFLYLGNIPRKNSFSYPVGNLSLRIDVSTDQYGVELDTMRLSTDVSTNGTVCGGFVQ